VKKVIGGSEKVVVCETRVVGKFCHQVFSHNSPLTTHNRRGAQLVRLCAFPATPSPFPRPLLNETCTFMLKQASHMGAKCNIFFCGFSIQLHETGGVGTIIYDFVRFGREYEVQSTEY
jgi:hypothetical protein